MAYEPLALKYRPRHFSDLVGQEATAATLLNAIRSGRVANAFLFSGSRGVGKTSMARILAKALNCPETTDGESCGACPTCEAIARGDDMDVIEIDGASNRGIDEIRAIRENAGYTPANARHKVYIIDEVHMLTIQAFNALLKTLEEPPPHVKFIFATTEAQAVPETIHSRCQRFEFRRISVADIAGRLQHICAREGITVGSGVLEDIAEKSEGGLRDSIGLLDQAVSYAGDEILMEHLDKVLGRVDTELLESLVEHAGEAATGPLLDVLDDIFESGRDAEDVLLQLVEVLREAMVREARQLPGGGEGRRAAVVACARKHFPLDRLLFALRVALNARREMKLVGQGRLQLELALLKIARSRDLLPIEQIIEQLEGGGAPAGSPRGEGAGAHGDSAGQRASWKPPAASPESSEGPHGSRATTTPPRTVEQAAGGSPNTPSLGRLQGEWGRILAAVRKRSPQVGAYLEGGAPDAVAGSVATILLPAGQTFACDKLSAGLGRVAEEALNEHLGSALSLSFEVAAKSDDVSARSPKRTVYEDRDVRKILDTFEGSVMSVENEDQS